MPVYSTYNSNHCRGITPINPNHTHFIFADDGSVAKFGGEITFRTRLETHINKQEVPIVVIVMEGGSGTLKTIRLALESKMPVILVAVSFLAYLQ